MPRLPLYALVLTVACSVAPAVAAERSAETKAASLERLTKDVKFLASDELEGRGVGTEGLQKAADFLRDEFQKIGLKPGGTDGGYFQNFEVPYDVKQGAKSTVVLKGPDGKTLELQQGKQFQPIAAGGSGQANAEIVFAGYGIKFTNPHSTDPDEAAVYDDFAGVDVKGKVVVFLRHEPQQDDEKSLFDGKKTTNHSYIQTKLKQAKDHGAAAVLFVNDPNHVAKQKGKDDIGTPQSFGWKRADVPFVFLKQSVVDEMLAASPLVVGDANIESLAAAETAIDAELKPISQPVVGWTAEVSTEFKTVTDTVENVIGVLEGEGPLADETVVVGAHYDHLGFGPYGSRASGADRNKLHNGADDNATGTAAILEIARRFAANGDKPRRRVVFIGFGGEERGLLGSMHYVKNPVFPLEKTVAMINFDMIGRLRNDKLTVMGAGTGREFGKLLDELNTGYGFKLAKQASGSGGSDQAAFVGKKVPVMFFFTGTTKEYHTPADTVDLVNFEGLQKVTDFAGDVTWAIVSADERPEYVSVGSTRTGGQMAYLGVKPDYGADVLGLKINGSSPDSPAEKAGMKEGDVITQFGSVPVADINSLAQALRKYKPGQTVDVTVKRGKEKVELKVTLGKPKN